VRLNWKLLQLAILTACTLSLAGCGGINAGGSVSPATFFLPGLMKNDAPAPPAGDPVLKVAIGPSQQFAQAR
jgi:hypothetical protein